MGIYAKEYVTEGETRRCMIRSFGTIIEKHNNSLSEFLPLFRMVLYACHLLASNFLSYERHITNRL